MTKKIVNDAVAYLQSLAELRARNIEWAEATVRDGANLRATEALEQNVIDIVAPDLTTLLNELDGWEVKVGNGTQVLETAGAVIVRVETDWRHELLTIITDPSIAYGLLIIGVYGLILEFYSPGMIFPAVTGIICLLLGAYGLQMLPINYAGLALIVVGIVLIAAEVLTPTYGVLGVGGVAAFVMGSIMLMDTDMPGYQLPIPIILGFAVSTGGIAFFVVGSAIQARRQKVITGVESVIGAGALVLDDFDGRGSVRAFGEVWGAESDVPLQKDMKVRITKIEGLTLTVEPED
jgi:membrane-bound serine protease (ClpP class)